jgi:hypothetical protein
VTVRPAAVDLSKYAALFGISHSVDLLQVIRIGAVLGVIARREIQEVPLGRRCVIGRGEIHNDFELL